MAGPYCFSRGGAMQVRGAGKPLGPAPPLPCWPSSRMPGRRPTLSLSTSVFSAPNYCDQMGNKAAYIHLRGSDLRPQFHQFTAVVSLPPSLGQSGEPFWGRESGQWGLVSASGAPRTPSCPSPTAGPFLCLTLCLWFCSLTPTSSPWPTPARCCS